MSFFLMAISTSLYGNYLSWKGSIPAKHPMNPIITYVAPTTIIPGMASKFSLLMKYGFDVSGDSPLNLGYM